VGAKELALFGGFERVIWQATMADVIISVYRLSSVFLEWVRGPLPRTTSSSRQRFVGRRGSRAFDLYPNQCITNRQRPQQVYLAVTVSR